MNKGPKNYANMLTCEKTANVNEEKRKCQECLRGHSLSRGVFGNTMLPVIVVCKSFSLCQ